MTISAAAIQREEVASDLWSRTASVAGELNRAHADLVEIAVALLADNVWADGGFRSIEHYFIVRAGLSPAHARDVVAVARRSPELSVMAELVADGALSIDQAAVIAHHVPASHQRSVSDLAQHLTVPQLRRAVSRHAFGASCDQGREDDGQDESTGDKSAGDEAAGQESEAEQSEPKQAESQQPESQQPEAGSGSSLYEDYDAERRACAAPELSMHYDRDGRFQLRYSAPGTVGSLVEQAIKEAKDALFLAQAKEAREAFASSAREAPASSARADDAASMTRRPTYADALAEMAHRSLSTVASSSRHSHYRIYLHLSADGAWVNGGGAIPQRLLDQFLSNASLQPVWEREGRPVSVARAMRILPARSRRLIEDRDRGCRFPGCTATRFVEIHHLTQWSDGGATDDDNQVSLCPFHHDAIDRGDYRISGDPTRPDGLSVVNRYGVTVGPPTRAELSAPAHWSRPTSGRHSHRPPGRYTPPTGGKASWAHTVIPPDRDLRPVGARSSLAASAAPGP